MPEYEVTWVGEVREVYYVEADSEEGARALWSEDPPILSEAYNGEVVDVTRVEEESDECPY